MKHTATPWKLGDNDIGIRGQLRIVGNDNKLVAFCEAAKVPSNALQFERPFAADKANAALIVACVNAVSTAGLTEAVLADPGGLYGFVKAVEKLDKYLGSPDTVQWTYVRSFLAKIQKTPQGGKE